MKFQGVPTSFYHEMTHRAAERKKCQLPRWIYESIKELLPRYSHAICHAAHEFCPAPSAACHSGGTGRVMGRPGQPPVEWIRHVMELPNLQPDVVSGMAWRSFCS